MNAASWRIVRAMERRSVFSDRYVGSRLSAARLHLWPSASSSADKSGPSSALRGRDSRGKGRQIPGELDIPRHGVGRQTRLGSHKQCASISFLSYVRLGDDLTINRADLVADYMRSGSRPLRVTKRFG